MQVRSTTTRRFLTIACAAALGIAGTAVVAHATPTTTGNVTYSGIEGPFNTTGLAGTVPANLALNPLNVPAGPTAFASAVIFGGSLPFHQIVHLNDGSYSNSRSWIGAAGGENNTTINVTGVGPVSGVYAGVDLKNADTITSFAFGSDNGNYLQGQVDPNVPSNGGDPNENSAVGDTGAYHDRTGGTYYVQYTTAANPAAAPDSSWLTAGTVSLVDGTNDSYRHVYDLTSPVTATGLRLVLEGTNGNRIDELEVYGSVPEPASLSLLGLAGVGLLARRRR